MTTFFHIIQLVNSFWLWLFQFPIIWLRPTGLDHLMANYEAEAWHLLYTIKKFIGVAIFYLLLDHPPDFTQEIKLKYIIR